MDSEGGGKVYLTFHKSFVREGVPYVDRDTGEERTFRSGAPRGFRALVC